jgi:hypothetical protein
MTNHGLTEEDTRDRDRWRNLVLGKGKPLYSGQTLDDDDDDDDDELWFQGVKQTEVTERTINSNKKSDQNYGFCRKNIAHV